MKNSPHARKHRGRKAIKQAQKMPLPTDPKSPTPKQKKRHLSSGKRTKWAKGRKNFHHSKHTSPKEVTFDTEPESIHQEGLRWMRNIQAQTKSVAKRISNKLLRNKRR